MNWNELYLEEVTPWDKGDAAPPLIEWLEANPGVMQGEVLVPGCGSGHDVRAIAHCDKVTLVTGLDIAPEAIKRADSYPRAGKERFLQGDLFRLELQHLGRYDWVWEHTCFCAIDPEWRSAYVTSVFEALKPGGSLLAVFYLDPYD